METNELIKVLSADARPTSRPLPLMWWGAAALGFLLAAVAFAILLGPRPDIAAAAGTPRFLFKFVVTIVLAATALGAVRALSRPGETWRTSLPWLFAAPALLAAAVAAELFLVPAGLWNARLVGSNSLVCLTYVTVMGVAPLVVFLAALRHGATTRPGIAGAAAGLLAGGIAATFYAAHCPDDSPLFVATWYTLAVAGLALVGALAATRFTRW